MKRLGSMLACLLLLRGPLEAKPAPGMTIIEGLPEQKQIYHPTRGRTLEPAATGLPLHDLYFQADDGVRLNAWWLPAPKGAPTVLYFHGNGGSLSGMDATFHHFHKAALGALVVDYRGYGLSGGYPSEEGLYRDARAAYQECLRREVRPAQLIIHGQSLGGAIAVQLASERACAGLILESTFTSAHDMAARLYGKTAASTLRTRYPSVATVAHLKCRLLVIHGEADEMIPATMGKALYAAAPQPKRLWVVPGAGHNNLRNRAGEEFSQQLKRFASECGPH